MNAHRISAVELPLEIWSMVFETFHPAAAEWAAIAQTCSEWASLVRHIRARIPVDLAEVVAAGGIDYYLAAGRDVIDFTPHMLHLKPRHFRAAVQVSVIDVESFYDLLMHRPDLALIAWVGFLPDRKPCRDGDICSVATGTATDKCIGECLAKGVVLSRANANVTKWLRSEPELIISPQIMHPRWQTYMQSGETNLPMAEWRHILHRSPGTMRGILVRCVTSGNLDIFVVLLYRAIMHDCSLEFYRTADVVPACTSCEIGEFDAAGKFIRIDDDLCISMRQAQLHGHCPGRVLSSHFINLLINIAVTYARHDIIAAIASFTRLDNRGKLADGAPSYIWSDITNRNTDGQMKNSAGEIVLSLYTYDSQLKRVKEFIPRHIFPRYQPALDGLDYVARELAGCTADVMIELASVADLLVYDVDGIHSWATNLYRVMWTPTARIDRDWESRAATMSRQLPLLLEQPDGLIENTGHDTAAIDAQVKQYIQSHYH